TVPGTTVNRLCGSGLEAVVRAGRAIALGDASIAVAGGAESMSRAPWILRKPGRGFPAGHQELWSTTLGWRMTNPAMPPEWAVPLGESAELVAEKHGIDREAQDAYALASHAKAARAWKDAHYDAEVAPLDGIDLSRDESVRDGGTPAVMAKLTPSFRPAGTVTAGDSSPLDDGAAALLLADEDGLRALGREPLARVRASAVTALDPRYFGLGPVEASRTALACAGLGFEDLTTVELNEAFAAQVHGCLAELPALDPAKVNPYGGALALGHPLGASGGRIAGAVAHQLARAGTGTGFATLRIGVGQGLALVLER
ncbi:acetyl-CoA acetyltransferases, partial [Streptomyces sp. SolWspMP-sol7th]